MTAGDKTASRAISVWDVPTRVFHWLLVCCVAIGWLTGGSGSRWHETIGFMVAGLVLFRLIWGIVGTRHALFSSFIFSPSATYRYLNDLIGHRARRYIGHNPAGALMVFALLGVLASLCATGMMMQSDAFFGVSWVERTHKAASTILICLIPLHVVGVFISSALHRENLLFAMLSGQKPIATRTDRETSVRSLRLRDQVHGTHGFIILLVGVAIGGVYGWNSTSGRQTIVEDQPPAETLPSNQERQLAQDIRETAPIGERQDYVSGGPAVASRTWMISSGGRLYDNWFRSLGKPPPTGRHPSWPHELTRTSDADTWRCKSCHGWDYLGRDGQSGIGEQPSVAPGIRRMRGRAPSEIISILGDKTHGFSDEFLPPHAKLRTAMFVAYGQHTISRYISHEGNVLGDAEKGRPLFQTICAACHGFDGKTRKLGLSANRHYKGAPLFVGTKANGNPVEVLHKIRNGHPGAIMVSMRGFPMIYSTRLLAYVQTLPKE
ncbi:MAG: cytochrome b/b6 domain-containing protein [Planctomycetaceae bacterium]|nr:cytochrome b/b6 domain-containing protein [Planctomycetaceae bacterium]